MANTVENSPRPGSLGCLELLRAVVLLDGSVRPNPFATAIGRSLLDLPVSSRERLLSFWRGQTERLARMLGRPTLAVRVFVDRSAPLPSAPEAAPEVDLSIQRDPVAFRGSGGLLHDIGAEYDDDDFLLVSSGTCLLLSDLASIALRLAGADADVAVVSHRDGTPGGMLLTRCGALRNISPVGFVDMKEQALPVIAARHPVRAIHFDKPTSLPIRTPTAYLHALRVFHDRAGADGGRAPSDPFEESWQPSFAIIEPGAIIDPLAELLDSVALAGSQVLDRAAVVRSVVCPGAIVKSGQTVLGELVQRENR